MSNSPINTDFMLHLPKEQLQTLRDDAADLIEILNNKTPDIYHQVAASCNKPRPLCRGDHWCTRPCIARDPWDETLLPKLVDSDCVHDWLRDHGIDHGHVFYHNFCQEHMGQFERSNGEWVPSKPKLERRVAGPAVHVEQQEGPLYYVNDSAEEVDVDELLSFSTDEDEPKQKGDVLETGGPIRWCRLNAVVAFKAQDWHSDIGGHLVESMQDYLDQYMESGGIVFESSWDMCKEYGRV